MASIKRKLFVFTEEKRVFSGPLCSFMVYPENEYLIFPNVQPLMHREVQEIQKINPAQPKNQSRDEPGFTIELI